MQKLVLFFFLITAQIAVGQNELKVHVKSEQHSEPIEGAKVYIKGAQIGGYTDQNGTATLKNVPDGPQVILISAIGFSQRQVEYNLPISEEPTVLLTPDVQEIEEIRVEATRSNRSISNLPTRTEILTEEIDEAASMEPSKVSHLLTHSTGIQVQTTSATSNGAVVRVQGLNGRYTQMLKDGFPLYGGFSGSLDIMQIPPLDLRQVEYIKGSASTLYGGGAIGGLINLLSKKPTKEETLLHLNMSHIGSKDMNAFASRKFGKFGFTNLASFHMHSPYDADNDGYSDLPDVVKLNFNPKFYFFPDNRSTIYLGAMISDEKRTGGDMSLLDNNSTDSTHFYQDAQHSRRYTSQFSADRRFGENSVLTLKNSVSYFNRFIQIRSNALGETSKFAGNQLNSFSEFNYNLNKNYHNLTIGGNFYTDKFTEQELDTSDLRNQGLNTAGVFINYLWDITDKISLESGLRGDYVMASTLSSENKESFVLPKLSALFKINRNLSMRLGGGLGYRMPTIFNEDSEPYGYNGIAAIDYDSVVAERSYGANYDFKYQSNFGTENILFSFNQMFFYNVITNPILLGSNGTGLAYNNVEGVMNSRGFESQIKLTFWQFTWFFGYTYTDAALEANDKRSPLTLTPEHSIKGDLLFVVEDKWRIGWDYEFKSQQVLSTGLKSRTLFTTGIIVERTIENFVIFLNAENFTDVRQTKYESILSGPNSTPQFTDIWAPLDGFFFNAGLKIKL